MTFGRISCLASCMIILMLASLPAAIAAASGGAHRSGGPGPDAGRAGPPNSPPFVKAAIPDFSVYEGYFNATMGDIDLFEVFSDPDLPPAGNDSLAFWVDNSSFPATITAGRLAFGLAPMFPGHEDHVVLVAVGATDLGGEQALLGVNVTILDVNTRPLLCETGNMVEILEDEVSYFELDRMFIDPDGDPLDFTFLGGASGNLTVDVQSNRSAMLRPARDYFTSQEVLKFRATDPRGANVSGELFVRVIPMPDPLSLTIRQIPVAINEIIMDEGEPLTFTLDIANEDKMPELKYTWFVDDIEKVRIGTPNFTWRPAFDEQGPHDVRVRISDGVDYTDAEWNVSVNDTNRPPVIVESWPQNNTEIGYGTSIKFCATAGDPDGDPLTFQWRLSDGTLLKTQSGVNTSSFSKPLSGGRQHIVVLEVDDGNGGAARYFIYIKVDARSVPDPEYRLLGSIFRGPDPSLAIFPILAGAAAISMRILMEAADMRHRRK